MSNSKKEALLVLRAQTGDLKAMDKLLESIQEALFRYIRGIVHDAASAQDVLQDVFVIIYRKIKHLRQPAFFRSWAFRIASREALRVAKREKKWREHLRDDQVIDALPDAVTTPFDAAERAAGILALVNSLPPGSRAVVLLHYQEEMSLQTVANVLGLPLGTVKSRLSYGLSALRSALNQ